MTKLVTLREATEDQIEEAVLRHPDLFGFTMTFDHEERMEQLMNDWRWESGFTEAVDMYPESYPVDRIGGDGSVDFDSEKTRETFKEYIKNSPEADEDIYIYVKVEKGNYYDGVEYVNIKCFRDNGSGDKEECKFVGDELEMEIEVDE